MKNECKSIQFKLLQNGDVQAELKEAIGHYCQIYDNLEICHIKSSPPVTASEENSFFEKFNTFSNNCTSLLKAIYQLSTIQHPSLFFIEDKFKDMLTKSFLEKKPDAKDWKNGAGLLFLDLRNIYIEPLSWVKYTDTQFSNILKTDKNGCFNLTPSNDLINKFKDNDVKNENMVIRQAMQESKLSYKDMDAFIFTNRTEKRHDKIVKELELPKEKIFYSRHALGHRGSLDIAYNLDVATKTIINKKRDYYILLSAQGMGYEWAAMILKIKNY